MKYPYFISLLLILSQISLAQDKLFTTKDTEVGIRRELNPIDLKNLQWQGSSENFTYRDKDGLFQQSVNNSTPVKIVSLAELNQIIAGYQETKIAVIPDITWENKNEFHFFTEKYWYAIKIPVLQIVSAIKLPEKSANYKVCYHKKQIACTIENNVYILSTNNNPIAVTTDKNPDIVNGDIVSRNEFGIEEGLFWSPKGNYLAFYRKDNSKVKSYPLVDIFTREAEAKLIKYPMAGMSSENVSLGIYKITGGIKTFIEKEDTVSEKYLTNISWSPDENNIYIQVLNRQQNHMKLNKYSIHDGNLVKTLFEEKNVRYVEPQFPLYFLHKTPSLFIYQSRRDGYNHAYLYDTNGKLIRQLTSGNWEITKIEKIDDNDNMYYLSTEESPLDQTAYVINIPRNKKLKLFSAKGTYNIVVNPQLEYCLLSYNSITVPRNIDLVSTSGKLVRNILTATNPLSGFKMPEATIGTIKSADGITNLYYRLIKPIDFNPDKKYPVIIYVYGGPHAQLISDRWLGGARLWDYMMAQKGYVLFTVDNRGSQNRGQSFENVIYRQCGVAEMQDQMEGVKYLKQQYFVDTLRIGVHGWSYGGFMTTSLMTNYPETFKVGVAGGPVIDWKYYEVMYGERYMDTPEENPEGYQKTSLIDKTKKLKGKLLIIHGAQDPTVVWQNSLLFINECIKNNVPVDYFVYPNAEHNVRGYDRIHLMDKITSYFDNNL